MATCQLRDVTSGAELAAPIENRQGRVLVNAGVVLSEGMLQALENWGITEVSVVGAALEERGEPAQPAKEDASDAVEEELRHHFRKTNPEDSVVKELFRLAKLAKTYDAAQPQISNQSGRLTDRS